MSDHPALDCLKTACTALADRNTSLRQWRVALEGFVIRIELEWTGHTTTLIVREPESERAFGRTASFSFGIQMDEATELMSHELEVHLTQFIETVRKADPGGLPLPQETPTWDPGAGPPSTEPESDEPESDEPESDEPAVGLDVVSHPQPKVHHREGWISEAADRAHGTHQRELNWGIFCALQTLEAESYPFPSILGEVAPGPHAAAHTYLVNQLEHGFSTSIFQQKFGVTIQEVCGAQLEKLLSFESLREHGDQFEANIGHPARLRVYQTFLYSPEVHLAFKRLFGTSFDPHTPLMNELMSKL